MKGISVADVGVTLIILFCIRGYCEEVKLTADDWNAQDNFGLSVAMDTWDGHALVCAPYDEDNGTSSGSAYIFREDYGGTGNWGQYQKLLPSDGESGAYFGISADLDFNHAVIGASYDLVDEGRAYIFYKHYYGPYYWGQQTELTASDGSPGNLFGMSCAIHGDFVLVGAPGSSPYGIDHIGAAYLFGRYEGGNNNWGQIQRVLPYDGGVGDYYGWSVDMDDELIIIGAYLSSTPEVRWGGSAYIYTYDSSGNMSVRKKLLPDDGEEQDNFGYSVAISGDYAVVGSPNDDDNGFHAGAAYVYYRNQGGTNNWGLQSKLSPHSSNPGAHFGDAVDIEGDRIMVGAYWGPPSGYITGCLHYFERQDDSWVECDMLLPSDGIDYSHFGDCLQISDGKFIVGAPHHSVPWLETGTAYIYDFEDLYDLDAPVLSITIPYYDTARLSWNMIPGATRFDIYRSVGNPEEPIGDPWVTISAPSTQVYTTQGIGDPEVNYCYCIRARNDEQCSGPSNTVGEFDFSLGD